MDFVVVVAHWCGPQACAPQHLQRSSLFAAALCEISGRFLIFRPGLVSGTALNDLRLALGSVAPHNPRSPLDSPYVLGSRKPLNRALLMKIERFASHHEAGEALLLSVAGVTAIMLIESLILLILY
jgi:hypothetical protein